MPQLAYFPDSDPGIRVMLACFDDNIGAFTAKYSLSSATVLRIRQGRLCWGWLLDCLEAGRDWAESVTADKDRMFRGPAGGGPQVMPVGPVLPAVPTIDLGMGLQPVQWEPDFFTFFRAIVAGIKAHPDYLKSDGDLLHIEGAVIPPPDPAIVTPLAVTLAAGGQPQLEVPKGVFEGFDFWVQIGTGPEQPGTFSTKRRYIYPLPLPPAGTAVVVTFRAQYRYQGQPFGQKSLPVAFTLRG